MVDQARPKPDTRITPTEDEFESWCQQPVTRFVAAAMHAAALTQRDAWERLSWGAGEADPKTLCELRTRADAYNAFLETGLREYVAIIEAK